MNKKFKPKSVSISLNKNNYINCKDYSTIEVLDNDEIIWTDGPLYFKNIVDSITLNDNCGSWKDTTYKYFLPLSEKKYYTLYDLGKFIYNIYNFNEEFCDIYYMISKITIEDNIITLN